MSLEEDKKFIEEIESGEDISAIYVLQEIVDTAIGRKAFETFGVQYPVEFLAWCYTPNYTDLPTHIGYMPVEILDSPEVLLAASIACIRHTAK